jgi:hypothetical protein
MHVPPSVANRKLMSWLTTVVSFAVFAALFWFIGSEAYHKKEAARVAYNTMRAHEADHACEAWRTIEKPECTIAYEVWRRCRANLMSFSNNDPQGVICEHPKYRFQAQLQSLMDRVQAEVDGAANSPK